MLARQSRYRMLQIFKLWDGDGNGDIDLFNLVAIAEDLEMPMSNKRAKEVIKRTSMSDAITFDEFENLMVREH